MRALLTGSGGFGALQSNAVDPIAETGLQDSLFAVDALHSQVYFDLRTISDQGYDTTGYKASADAIAVEIEQVRAELVTMDPSEVHQLQARIEDLRSRTRKLLEAVAGVRRGVPQRQQIMGLLWGLGAMAAAGALTWFVWNQSKRRR